MELVWMAVLFLLPVSMIAWRIAETRHVAVAAVANKTRR